MYNLFHPASVRKKIVLSFSGGKDSILALYRLRCSREYEVVALLSTLDSDGKVLMHGFTSELLQKQAEALGIPLHEVTIPRTDGDRSAYAETMKDKLTKFKASGVTCVAYGDIFLEDVRRFRQEKLSIVDMDSIFPLWGINTMTIAEEFIAIGFKAIITCVNTKLIPKEWIGREFDKDFIAYLVSHKLDPCGENGEFHTFVYSGPGFTSEVKYQIDLERPIVYNEFYACVAMPQGVVAILKS